MQLLQKQKRNLELIENTSNKKAFLSIASLEVPMVLCEIVKDKFWHPFKFILSDKQLLKLTIMATRLARLQGKFNVRNEPMEEGDEFVQ